MTLAYIRKTYGVDARRGGRIEWTDPKGGKWPARITGALNGSLLVRFDSLRKDKAGTRPLHPTDNVRYLAKPAGPKDRVLAEYPLAHAVKVSDGYRIRSSDSAAYCNLGRGANAKAAWIDAAREVTAPKFREPAYREIGT